ncbi:alpha/beta hydrolase [Reichenbachiella ulvae]|uniref:Phospholipase/Carboxylesterase n=1 Tax=Reichenbachiella ulvae TaxID=2980104 RepID=A0ABT3CUA9_9BACT|nr:hypothetical protein [Reichenbachiella ulvae]MCV9386818.1 hypothetical protein [Reichenbachiella ulvae]
MIKGHSVKLKIEAPYHSLFELTPETQHIWIVCHGYGQLSKRFIANFDHIDSAKNYVIALQGLSKFYLANFRHVGASWMTREDREVDLQNQKNYFEAIYERFNNGAEWEGKKVHLLGFSQGASAICRFAAHLKVDFHSLVLWAGSFPPELTAVDFEYLTVEAQTYAILADQDEYFSQELFDMEIEKMELAMDTSAKRIGYTGTHQLDRKVIDELVYSNI